MKEKPGSVTIMAGALGIFGPVHLLRMVQAARATGRLELSRGTDRVDLYVELGRSIFARSTGITVRLGEVLVRQGNLRPEAVELALALQEDSPGKRIGRMLVESGSVTEAQVREAVLALQREILCDVLLWKDGTYRFIIGERAPEEDVRLDLDLDRLVLGILAQAGMAHARPPDQAAA